MSKSIDYRHKFNKDDMRYFYIREDQTFSGCAFSFAFMYDHEEKKFNYSVAFCSPRDRFSKKKAHLILQGRMGSGNCLSIPSPTDLKYGEALDLIINSYDAEFWRHTFRMPSWARIEIEEYIDSLDDVVDDGSIDELD